MLTKVPYNAQRTRPLIVCLIATVSVLIAVFGDPVAAVAAAAVARTLAGLALWALGSSRGSNG
jgi:hypothetical protein